MNKKHYLLLLLFVFSNIFSQSKIKVGDKAPKINITEFLLNAPENNNIENKFIVLEFWATWCAPCLEAVPHINELQNEFKSQKDLLFISLSDENAQKIKRTLSKITFNTIVANDESKVTNENFVINSIPQTVLIDNNGIIKWVGMPRQLKKEMINKFLKNEILDDKPKKQTISKDKKSEVEDTSDSEEENRKKLVSSILKNKDINYNFSIEISKKSDNSSEQNAISIGKFISDNNKLIQILSNVTKIRQSQMSIPDNLKKNNYNVVYKNKDKIDPATQSITLKNEILKNLKLTESIETKSAEVYVLKVTDRKKIDFSPDQESIYSNNSNGKLFYLYSNIKIETLTKQLENIFDIMIVDETKLTEKLDFTIKINKLKDLNKELENYGLVLEKTTKEIDFYTYK